MNLIRWDPFRELEDMSTRFNQYLGLPVLRRRTEENGGVFADFVPPLDVEETDKEYLVKADLPDMKKEDLKIGIEDGMLNLEGERKQQKEEKGRKFHRIERSYGKFVRRLALPSDVDEQKVAADFKDGVLNVHMPKLATAKPKTIDVKVM
jgi:HSP20 family protein